MSKKKASSTMSLKDFHGGSIPSDLPLPSAPGFMVRSGSDRNASMNWGNNSMWSDLRPRPKSSSGAARGFDEKASFLSHPASIGHNFDEDERKPLDGSFVPRRTISDESIRSSAPVCQELKVDYASSVRVSDRLVSSPITQSPSLNTSLSTLRLGGGTSVMVDSQNANYDNGQVTNSSKTVSGNSGYGVNCNPPNAWGLRKDVMGVDETRASSVSSGPNAASKFAQASALDKVSSGLWQSKNSSHLLPHFVYSKDDSATCIVGGERDDYGASRGSQAETGQVAEDVNRGWGRELPSYGRGHPQAYTEEMKTGASDVGTQPPSGLWQSKNRSQLLPQIMYSKDQSVTHTLGMGVERNDIGASRGSQAQKGQVAEDGNQGWGRELPTYRRSQPQLFTEEVQTGASGVGSQLPSTIPQQISEQPKSKLLPRSKQLETSEIVYRQEYQQASESWQNEIAHDLHGNADPPKPGSASANTGSQLDERPKLNLKPRSQPFEQSDGSLQRERNPLFGGARPREVVLKERGVDDTAINNLDLNHLPDRLNSPTDEMTLEHLVPTFQHGQKIENCAPSRRFGRDSGRKDQQVAHEKADVERRDWRNEKWRSSRDVKDQRTEPETWRKPIEDTKPALPDASGIRHGKLVSAVELAQAFSKSVSDPKSPDLRSSQGGLPGRNSQMSFSRLADTQEHCSAPTARHRINGY